jgi:hypothetical protein
MFIGFEKFIFSPSFVNIKTTAKKEKKNSASKYNNYKLLLYLKVNLKHKVNIN